ncbi:hypothetical protein K1T71_002905 [Dendrolimus kikuchii]|uniref:Uncharacterized protein n=1 Tax=Dendrolimus kikuchii TaxID=765133 RepID=A0ACC1DE02_9NEOP|nr:hypothetical protein K1T71_002905 [Dendrolimus kikuchii]
MRSKNNEGQAPSRSRSSLPKALALVLLACASAAATAAADAPAFSCRLLAPHDHATDRALGARAAPRRMQARGVPRNVTFFWYDAPSRAAAALLARATSATPTSAGTCSTAPRWQPRGCRRRRSSCRAAGALVYILRRDHAKLAEDCFGRTGPRTKVVTRARLNEFLLDSTRPLLFLDHNLWTQVRGVEPVHLPPRCYHEPNPGVRVVDEQTTVYANDVRAALANFDPDAAHLREVLEAEEAHAHAGVLEAACEWGRNNTSPFLDWIPSHRKDYVIGVFLCHGPDLETYRELLGDLDGVTDANASLDYSIKMDAHWINCTQRDSLRQAIHRYTESTTYYDLVGIVSDAEHSRDAAREARERFLPLVLVRESEALAEGAGAARVAGGSAGHAARALRGLLRRAGWSRLALIADDTHATRVLRARLAPDFVVKYVNASERDERALEHLLRALEPLDPRVVVLNVEPPARVASVLAKAAALGMTPERGFAWVSCTGPLPSAKLAHLALSFWERAADTNASGAAARAVARHWARHSKPLADAVVTLRHGFHLFYKHYPQFRYDLRTNEMIRLFWQSYSESPAAGVSGRLLYEAGALRDTRVHLLSCEAEGACQPVDVWRDRWLATRTPFAAPPDGASHCWLPIGDPYWPSCRDYALVAVPLAAALLAGAVGYVRRSYRRRLAEREAEVRRQLQQWKERAAGALAGYLVDRDALAVDGRLGEGRFGCVRFAVLREPGAPPRPVAVKALREGAAPAEEGEFLREASTLASLDHENVIRFVGVCAGDGPPLMLMEHAFFGDLLAYLRTRRHLVEGAATEDAEGPCLGAEEAAHVSAAELTRLAREAASALGYLAGRGVVHRDVRASNCLVDARRTLKLSDFGLARQVGAGDDGAEYACRRRGLFPVLWMAPESLKDGVFSSASDVWSFGVLATELVTLGARPFGAWPPLRVLQYVNDGGQPPLPPDANPQTRALATLCWRRRPEQRPSAAELVAYLATNARALRPALWRRAAADADAPDAPDAPDADSAFGESPSNEHDEPFAFGTCVSPRSPPLS